MVFPVALWQVTPSQLTTTVYLMKEFLKALKDQRVQQAELLRQLETGKFGAFERGESNVKKLKVENVERLQTIIAELDRGIAQLESVVANLNNAGQL